MWARHSWNNRTTFQRFFISNRKQIEIESAEPGYLAPKSIFEEKEKFEQREQRTVNINKMSAIWRLRPITGSFQSKSCTSFVIAARWHLRIPLENWILICFGSFIWNYYLFISLLYHVATAATAIPLTFFGKWEIMNRYIVFNFYAESEKFQSYHPRSFFDSKFLYLPQGAFCNIAWILNSIVSRIPSLLETRSNFTIAQSQPYSISTCSLQRYIIYRYSFA